MDSVQRFASDYLARHAGALKEADAREIVSMSSRQLIYASLPPVEIIPPQLFAITFPS